jgi:heterotetrameric sarcosine oxidase gamma subunit
MADELPRLEDYLMGLSLPSLSVQVERAWQVATLRHFGREGAFVAAVERATGLILPHTQKCVRGTDGLILAWRSPTETLCLATDARALAQLATQLADAADGCLVSLSAALRLVRIGGARVPEILCRLGGTACVPGNGEARRGRLADVPVVTLRAGDGEDTFLIVDRVLAAHLLMWLRESLSDFVED